MVASIKGKDLSGLIAPKFKNNLKNTSHHPKFSSVKRGKAFHSKWAKKSENRHLLSLIKEKQRESDEKRAKSRSDAKKSREMLEQRKRENEKRGEVVQVIKNTLKLKRLKKKHLRYIEKREVS